MGLYYKEVYNLVLDKGLIFRTVVLVYALINNVLVMSGISALPFTEGQVEIAISNILTVLATLWAWYKNNSITKEAKIADGYLKEMKSKEAGTKLQ